MKEPTIVDNADVDAALDAAIRRTLCRCFPHDQGLFSKTRVWHGSAPSFVALVESDAPSDAGRDAASPENGDTEIVAHLATVDRTVLVGRTPVRVAGVQSVCVLPEYRGTGLSDRTMLAALDEAERRGFDFGMLFCLPSLRKVYARTGWQVLSGRTITRVDSEGRQGPIPDKNIAMIRPINKAEFPPGPVHLRGNDW